MKNKFLILGYKSGDPTFNVHTIYTDIYDEEGKCYNSMLSVNQETLIVRCRAYRHDCFKDIAIMKRSNYNG